MSLKLFKVDVESFVIVLAEDAKKAKDFVSGAGYGSDLSASDILEGSWVTASEIKSRKDLDSDWIESLPYVSQVDKRKEDNDDITDLTCGEIISKWEEEELKKLRQKEEDERFDKLQGKFDFTK